jgi:hypothetical protein
MMEIRQRRTSSQSFSRGGFSRAARWVGQPPKTLKHTHRLSWALRSIRNALSRSGAAFTHWRPSATAPEHQAGGPRGRADRAKSTSRRTYRASDSAVSEFRLGRITAGNEQVLRPDAVTIAPPPRPPTLSSSRCADCLRRGTGRAPRRAPQAESNVYSPWRCSPTRRPAKAESEAVQSSQIWPATHPPREAPTRAQK